MFSSKNMPKSKDRTWKEGGGLGECFMTCAKFLLISTFPCGFSFLEFMESYGCLEILGLNCK
jgi:hypothetical protein